MPGPYTRVRLGLDSSGRPLVVNRRTQHMLAAAESALEVKLTIVQGSYRAGDGAAASAGTHDKGGVIDIRSWDLEGKGVSVNRVVLELRRVGFAAWYRTKAQGFDPHIHAVAIGDRKLHPDAAAQVRSYRAGRNGLASNGPDDGPRVTIRTWEQIQRPPPPLPEVSARHMVDAYQAGLRRRPRRVHTAQVRLVQAALGIRLRTGLWRSGTVRRYAKRFGGEHRPTERRLTELGKGRFRVVG